MNLMLLSHETIWGSPLTPLRRRSAVRSLDAKHHSKVFTSRPLSNYGQAVTVRLPPSNKAISGVKALIGALSALPTTLIAGAGAAAAALTVPLTRNAISSFLKQKVPQPLSSPLAFLGHTYVILCAFYYIEGAILRWPVLRGTAVRRDYLAFYDWFVERKGMKVPRDIQNVPYATLIETFFQDSYRDRTTPSRPKPTWTQVILPNFLHVEPVHVWFSATSVWIIANQKVPFRGQLFIITSLIASGTLVNHITWTLARRTLFSLPVADQSALAIRKLKKEAEIKRREAWDDFQRELFRGRITAAWSSLKSFFASSNRLSELRELDVGIGASSGLSAFTAFLIGAAPPTLRTELVRGVIQPLTMDLAEANFALTFQMLIGMEILEKVQSTLLQEQPSSPWLQALLRPTMGVAFITVNCLRVTEHALALAPSIGHMTHLIGSALGVASFGLCMLLGVYLPRPPPPRARPFVRPPFNMQPYAQ